VKKKRIPFSYLALWTSTKTTHTHSGFVYGAAHWRHFRGRTVLEIQIRPRRASRPICSGCGQRGPGYDVLAQRRFEFVPLWGIAVFFLYAMRRVDCQRCGVKVERVPWAEGKNHLTTTYGWFLWFFRFLRTSCQGSVILRYFLQNSTRNPDSGG